MKNESGKSYTKRTPNTRPLRGFSISRVHKDIQLCDSTWNVEIGAGFKVPTTEADLASTVCEGVCHSSNDSTRGGGEFLTLK